MSVLTNPKILKSIFKSGNAKEEPVQFVKDGKIDHVKLNWDECWHVGGRAKINKKLYRFDCTFYKRHDTGEYELYDVDLK